MHHVSWFELLMEKCEQSTTKDHQERDEGNLQRGVKRLASSPVTNLREKEVPTAITPAVSKVKEKIPTDQVAQFAPTLRRVAYIWSPQLIDLCNLLPRVFHRASRVHTLIEAYGLLTYGPITVLPPIEGGKEHLLTFHSQEYVDLLEFLNEEEDSEKWMEKKEEFGISCDCPSFPRIFEVAKMIVGASLSGVQALTSKEYQVAINWTGGWHHSRRDEAAGFCYVNDIVISLLKLTESFKRVLYIDLDLHHGDAVQDAFAHTSRIMTVSFHKYSPGFYPGTGSVEDVGFGRGRYHCVNVPLEDGITDVVFYTVVKRVMFEVQKAYQPSAVVIQCGADCLVGDPMNSFNLTLKGIGNCVDFILRWNLPTLLLGGGGYHTPNTARCWTQLTAVALGVRLKSEIPDHQFFLEYGPDYQLEITPSNRPDLNMKDCLRTTVQTVFNNLQHIETVFTDK
ncbi:histone deacetylase 8-like [Apostichopus japonicus]|uniref:histone deacetylase 8-like n=1 Tax=Stichopus japonicus TaxID=307972 RepID=UPI003AB645BC